MCMCAVCTLFCALFMCCAVCATCANQFSFSFLFTDLRLQRTKVKRIAAVSADEGHMAVVSVLSAVCECICVYFFVYVHAFNQIIWQSLNSGCFA